MASDLEVTDLARLARALNPASRLPALILFCNRRCPFCPIRLALPLVFLAAVRVTILRHRDPAARSAGWQRSLRKITNQRGVLLLISEDADLARTQGADGSTCRSDSGHCRTLESPAARLVGDGRGTSAASVAAAGRARADAVLPAPVFARAVIPNAQRSGFFARQQYCAPESPVPVYGLGGINRRTALFP